MQFADIGAQSLRRCVKPDVGTKLFGARGKTFYKLFKYEGGEVSNTSTVENHYVSY